MSEFHVEVVQVGELRRNENADSLMITQVRDYPVQVRTGDFQPGDLAVYVPVDSVVPGDDPRWEFLKGHNRIKAKRLRGVFSMGLLTKAEPDMKLGENVAERLRIKKYEPPEEASAGGQAEHCPFAFPNYTDLDSIRRQPDILREGEEVVLTEKIHGSSARYVFAEDRIWVGSHKEVKKEAEDSIYWKPVKQFNLAERLRSVPGIALYGEVYGWVQNLRYGFGPGRVDLVLFDAMELRTMKYLDVDAFLAVAEMLNLPTVPILYRGPWKNDLRTMAEGTTTLVDQDEKPINHVREGFVVRPVKERFDERVGRVCLKYHGEGYLLREEKR